MGSSSVVQKQGGQVSDSNNTISSSDHARIAAIDLGSNSFHMLVAKVDQGELRPVEALGEKVQLAAGMDNGYLTTTAITRGVECLTRFHQAITALKPDIIRAVGTNALRAAKNSHEFTEQVSSLLGLPIEIISGREEARLVYLGVAHTLADDDRARLVIDIGGGSTEVIIGQRFQARLTESLHMGCISWREKFFPEGCITPAKFEHAYQVAYLEVLNIRKAYRRQGWDNVVGSSGTLNSIANVLATEFGGEREITRAGLEKLKKYVLNFTHTDELAALSGLKARRQNIFMGGLAICCALFDALEIKTMSISSGALREGVAYELLGRLVHEDVRERTVTALATRSQVDPDNAKWVEEVAAHLFAESQVAWHLSETDGQLLSWAARLHEIGLSIAHSQFHKHGQYIIDNADLPGFSMAEQQALGVLVRGHRRKFSNNIFTDLPVSQRQRLERLCILLRLAVLFKYVVPIEGLPKFKLRVKEHDCKLTFSTDWLSHHPLTKAELEIEKNYLSKVDYCLTF